MIITNTGFRQLCLSYLPHLGMRPAKKAEQKKNGIGFTFIPDPQIGEGYIWTYPIGTDCSVIIYNITFKKDMSFTHHHPTSLTITAYKSENSSDSSIDCNIIGYCANEGLTDRSVKAGTVVKSISINLTPEFIKNKLPGTPCESYPDLVKIISSINEKVYVPGLPEKLYKIANMNPAPTAAYLYYQAEVFEMIATIVEWYSENSPKRIDLAASKQDIAAMQTLHMYIMQNYSSRLELQEMAQMCCMSKSKLASLFRELFGTTVYDFILNCRIEHAKEMLRDRKKRISEISSFVGYEQQSSFSAAFHQKTGMSPNEYRKSVLHEQN